MTMPSSELRSPRLRLVAATPELVTADLAGQSALGQQLHATVLSSWPPEYYDESAMRWTLAQLEDPAQHGWSSFYLLADGTLVGLCGYKGPPDPTGTVEIGYGLAPEMQGKGYASEAVNALVDHALTIPQVRRIIAETLPALGPSIRVLERTGFRLIGEGSERGVIRFELTRTDAEAGRRTVAPHLRVLVRLQSHMAWANRRARDAVAQTSPEQRKGIELLGHILGAEQVWLSRMNGVTPTTAVWPALSLEQVDALARDNDRAFRELIFGQSVEGLRRNISYRTSGGDEYVSTVEDILLHLFLHGAYHRGQIAQGQRADGLVPASTDYIAFARGAPAAVRATGTAR
jgi:RimJ/RimL family protein N-acetyltransferase/uncharacterized damage-inducible protein DinB